MGQDSGQAGVEHPPTHTTTWAVHVSTGGANADHAVGVDRIQMVVTRKANDMEKNKVQIQTQHMPIDMEVWSKSAWKQVFKNVPGDTARGNCSGQEKEGGSRDESERAI